MTVWTKIKNFFRRFWYVCLVPAGLFFLHLFCNGSKRAAKLEERSTLQKEAVKKTKEKIKQDTPALESLEKEVSRQAVAVEEVIQQDLKKKAVRDEKASKYLPNL